MENFLAYLLIISKKKEGEMQKKKKRDKENRPNPSLSNCDFHVHNYFIPEMFFSLHLTGIRQMYLFPLTASKSAQLVLERRT
jgi:hypothetical protein